MTRYYAITKIIVLLSWDISLQQPLKKKYIDLIIIPSSKIPFMIIVSQTIDNPSINRTQKNNVWVNFSCFMFEIILNRHVYGNLT